jgi:hypothetical protein
MKRRRTFDIPYKFIDSTTHAYVLGDNSTVQSGNPLDDSLSLPSPPKVL